MKSRLYGLGQCLKISAAYSEFVGLPSDTTTVMNGEVVGNTKAPPKFFFNWVAWDQQNRRQAVNNTAG